MGEIFHIAIDGPTASGKGTVARELGRRLGIPALDTGAMYRAVALYIIDNDIDYKDNEEYIRDIIESLNLAVKIIDDQTRVYIEVNDVTDRIRTSEVARVGSQIADFALVKLTNIMRDLARGQSLILDGRNIASFVLPDAKYKFYLTASSEIRAKRRLAQSDDGATLDEIKKQIELRDKRDMTRTSGGALVQVDDAIVIDNSDMDLEQTIKVMIKSIAKDKSLC